MDISKFSVNKLRSELWTCHILCEQRCLRRACEWAEDLLYALPEDGEEKLISKLEKDLNDITSNFNSHYEHAKTCYELHEFDRAAFLLRDRHEDDKCRFLRYFAMYKAAEKKRMDLMNEVTVFMPKKISLKFNELRDSIERSMDQRDPDGWLLYVYGMIMHKFRLRKLAIEVLVKSINLTPINWSAWHLLSTLIEDKKTLHQLELPNHLFKVFFYYVVRLNLDMSNSEPWVFVGFKETKNFLEKYFKNSLYIKTLQAKSLGYQSNMFPEAMEIFSQIRQEDPYRVDSMDIYSNMLYVGKHRKELAKLAYDIERVDPFTPEANSCIANSYSAREQHPKAIVYFLRSLRIDPDQLNSWTLIGHEYVELKSTEKAQQAYRYALTINKRDCRAWLGLGNTYESSIGQNESNPKYGHCLYYYSQVAKYRPNDQIMLTAMDNIFEKLNKPRRMD